MKLVTYCPREPSAMPRTGFWIDAGIVDAGSLGLDGRGNSDGAASVGPSMVDLLGSGLHEYLSASNLARATVMPLDQVLLMPPVPAPGKFLCVGKNSKTHLDELRRTGLLHESPTEPTGFIKLNECLVGNDATVARPEGITQFDYEPELAFVIGTPGLGIRRDDAMRHVAGLTLFNDLTAREIQRQEVVMGTRFWVSKNMPGFGPVGPALVTLDEIPDPHGLDIVCSVNGERRIAYNTASQIFSIPDVIEHFSRHLPLNTGDMFSLGAPGGVAAGQPNAEDLFLRPGDVVDVSSAILGRLRTRIV